MGSAHQPGRFDITHGAVPGELCPHYSGEAGNESHAQRQDHVVFAEPQHGDKHQRQQNAGEGGQRVVDAHENLVHHAAEIAGERADQRAHDTADTHGAQRDEERGAHAHHHAAENVPPEVIGAEQVAQGRRQEFFAAHDGRRVIGCPHIAHQRQHRHDGGDGKSDAEGDAFLLQQHVSHPLIAAAAGDPAAG